MSFTMRYVVFLLCLAIYSPLTLAYQTMRIPAPLRYTFNPNWEFDTEAQARLQDNYTTPITAVEFPCKGYEVDMFNNSSGVGGPTTNFVAGTSSHIILTGESTSGSAQISMSRNNGSLTVIHSYEGSVGIHDQQQLDFTIPSDMEPGLALLVFSFFPLGSQEVFVSCAPVRIEPPRPGNKVPAPAIPFASRPDIFISDMNNSCTRDSSKELMFPNPGLDVTMKHTVSIASEAHTFDGTCLSVHGFGNGAKDNSTDNSVSVNFPAPEVFSPFSIPVFSARPLPTSRPAYSPRISLVPAPTRSSVHVSLATESTVLGSSVSMPPDSTALFSIPTSYPVSVAPTNYYNAVIPPRMSTVTRKPQASKYILVRHDEPISRPSHPHKNGTAQNPYVSLPISQNGTCGRGTRCPDNLCCSSYGYCGTGAIYCGSFTCIIGFGACSRFDNGAMPTIFNATIRNVAGRLRW